MTTYVGDRIVDKLKDRAMREYRTEEFAPIGGDAFELAQSERSLKGSDLRRLFEWVNQLALTVTCQGRRFHEIRDEFLMLFPMIASFGSRRGSGSPALSKGLQRVLFACLEAVDRGPAGEEGDSVRSDNMVVFRRFLEALIDYKAYQGG